MNINCETKVCDFGLARGFLSAEIGNSLMNECSQDNMPVTEYVATRWYRAPEIMLHKKYDSASDIWSLGCIFAELLNRKVMFPGKDYHDQLPKIIVKLGPIPTSMLNKITSPKLRAYVERLGNCLPPMQHSYTNNDFFFDYGKSFSNASPLALDMLKRMLVYEPSQRITAREALKHPYLKIYADCKKITKTVDARNAESNPVESSSSLTRQLSMVEPERKAIFDISFETTKNLPDVRQQLVQEISCCVSQYELESNCTANYKYFQI